MTTERDEIAPIIQMSCSTKMKPETATHYADNLITAGYRKPQPITTAEELNALPTRSVVMDRRGTVYHRWPRSGWQSAGPTLGSYIALPAKVLHNQEGSA